MTWIKHFAILMLSLSIAFGGFPAQAKPECPMAKMMQMEHMKSADMHGMMDCKGCDQMAKHEPKKLGCCDDVAYNAKCSALSSGIAMNLLTIKAEFSAIGTQILLLYPADTAIAFRHLHTQERPPKSLA